ncbi:hypothetical protein E1202_15770 [Saccharopolyspora karakumensis]|uniref:Uncharacterized protein n=1 Tax=Saccharopolyspora karakumensis TaxID=2530386 RepID=A0A4R5BQQ0_9PSEU|nr:hypothetical protein [Saccharopolyspora karakumensis]TDD87753.1 hypothetical protein E1202_15770 [Saccharopolyspora karakumensis]
MPPEHRDLVDRVRGRIAAAETYQTNLTARMRGIFAGGLHRDLATARCGAHNAYLDLGRFAIASAIPELFFEA